MLVPAKGDNNHSKGGEDVPGQQEGVEGTVMVDKR